MTLADIRQLRYVPPNSGRQVRMITDLVTILVTTADTDGTFTLVEIETPPSGGCPPHIHRYDDQCIYVVEGTYDVLIGDQHVEARVGTCVYLPHGTTFAYANTRNEPGRMLIFAAPGDIRESFMNDAGDHADRPVWEADMERVLAIAPKYGVEFVKDDIEDKA